MLAYVILFVPELTNLLAVVIGLPNAIFLYATAFIKMQ
jgi:hypothetical protein